MPRTTVQVPTSPVVGRRKHAKLKEFRDDFAGFGRIELLNVRVESGPNAGVVWLTDRQRSEVPWMSGLT